MLHLFLLFNLLFNYFYGLDYLNTIHQTLAKRVYLYCRICKSVHRAENPAKLGTNPASIYLFKFSDYALVYLLLTLIRFYTLFWISIVDFEQVNIGWEYLTEIQEFFRFFYPTLSFDEVSLEIFKNYKSIDQSKV